MQVRKISDEGVRNEKHIWYKTIPVLLSAICFTYLLLPPAYAASRTSNYNEDIAEFTALLVNKITVAQMDKRFSTYAEMAEIPKEKLIKIEIAKIHNPELDSITTRSARGKKPITVAQKGDHYYAPYLQVVGHAGIYSSSTTIVEAIGSNSPAREASLSQVTVDPGAVIMRVRTSVANRNKAGERARKYIGRGYNSFYFNGNKDENGGMHCAQLVWASYKFGANINLDTTGGDNIVWPRDLRNSSKAYVVKTF